MADILTIESRRISGTGQFKLSDAQLKYRRYTLYADIIRKQMTPYFNRAYEPPQTFYGFISLMAQGYVLQVLPIKYDSQVWIFDADISGENLIAIKCAYLGTLQTFFNLGNALALPSISLENTIKDYKFLQLGWDNINIRCDGDCAIQFTLKALPYDACLDDYKNPSPPPPPPDKPTPVPPGTPTNISPPYPGDTVSQKAPIDNSFTPPPLGEACQVGVLNFTVSFSRQGGAPETTNARVGVRGKVGQSWRSPSTGVVQIQTQGFAGGPCEAFDYRDVLSLGATSVILDVTSIVFPGV